MNDDKFVKGFGITTLLVAIIAITLTIGTVIGRPQGYKQGQLDYAAGKIEYTIQDGRTIQYLDGKE